MLFMVTHALFFISGMFGNVFKMVSWINNNEENKCGCNSGLQVKSRISPGILE